jgi:undecaprenyl-diphosphatase
VTALAAIILGAIQGATEFLPISSSAHLALLHHWVPGWELSPDAELTFDVALHFGTLIAILIYFGRDWVDLLRRRDRLVAFVLMACIPGAIAGAALESRAETAFRAPIHIALLLAGMGLLMAAAERWSRRNKQIGEMGWAGAVWIGLAQAFAIMPGVSRSGITMTVGLSLGMTREAAARFSFLLATPILLGATAWKARHLLSGGLGLDALPCALGVLAAAVTGLVCVHWLLQFLRRHTFYPFVVYRLVLAAGVVIAVLCGGR